jgi:Ca-activated chloride channel homolog
MYDVPECVLPAVGFTWRSTMSRAAVAVSLAITSAFAIAHGAGAAGFSPQSTFRVGIDLVSLTVTVTDPTEKYISGLSERDFAVTEDGIRQPVSFFMADHLPLDLAIVLDTSGSMSGPSLRLVQEAACGLARSLRPEDRGTVIDVKGRATVPQALTGDIGEIEAGIRRTWSGGTTGLYDGLYVVLREFARERREHRDVRRQALVVLSDGIDNASHLQFEDIIDLARRTDVAVYIVSPKPAPVVLDEQVQILSRAQYSMTTLAREAGGRIFVASNLRELDRIYGAIASELANQYELGYVPLRTVADGSFRRVAVRIVTRDDAKARTRAGYIAAR